MEEKSCLPYYEKTILTINKCHLFPNNGRLFPNNAMLFRNNAGVFFNTLGVFWNTLGVFSITPKETLMVRAALIKEANLGSK